MAGLELFDDAVEDEIRQGVIEPVLKGEYQVALATIPAAQRRLHANIPEKKRISYGRYYTVKVLGERLYARLIEAGAPAFEFAAFAFEHSDDSIARGVALAMLSFHGLEHFEQVTPYFETGAADEHWEVREFAAGKLAHYKIPRYVHMTDFPMTVTGKVRKIDMRAETVRILGL